MLTSHLRVVDKGLFDSGLYNNLKTTTGLHFYDDEDESFDEFMEIYEEKEKRKNKY